MTGIGPTLPTRVLRQVGSYQGYTGRPANGVATAVHVTQTGPQGCCERGGALPNISYLSRHAPRMSSTIDSVTSNRAKPVDVVHQRADVSDLVLVYRVPHTGIDTLRDDCIHRGEHLARLVDPVERNMRINIAAADEDRCAPQRALIVAGQSWGTDQAGT